MPRGSNRNVSKASGPGGRLRRGQKPKKVNLERRKDQAHRDLAEGKEPKGPIAAKRASYQEARKTAGKLSRKQQMKRYKKLSELGPGRELKRANFDDAGNLLPPSTTGRTKKQQQQYRALSGIRRRSKFREEYGKDYRKEVFTGENEKYRKPQKFGERLEELEAKKFDPAATPGMTEAQFESLRSADIKAVRGHRQDRLTALKEALKNIRKKPKKAKKPKKKGTTKVGNRGYGNENATIPGGRG